jgi:Ca-activated chloride channel family protein
MTFREPAVLLGLTLLPVAMLAYAAMQARRRREAAAFGSPALLPNVVTARPGWRRHIPAALLLLALAALILAVARPQRSVAAPQRAATVVLVNDVSGSMRADDVDPDRLTAAVESAKVLLDKTPDNFRLGLVTFADYAQQIVAPTTDRGAVNGALERMSADGGTAMGDGLARGLQSAQTPVPTQDGKGTRKLPAIIVLLSDGKNTLGVNNPLEVAAQARAARIPVFTIALGTQEGEVVQRDPYGFVQHIPVPPDKETLREIARTTGGRFFEAVSSKDAEQIYSRIGTRLTSRPEKREVTVAFAGGAFVLLALGGGLSLVWFGRLPS